MEVSVLIERLAALGFRASCSEPIAATVERPTREEALIGLRLLLEEKMQAGAEVVRMQIGHRPPTTPIWPEDDLTRAWLEGIEEARKRADRELLEESLVK